MSRMGRIQDYVHEIMKGEGGSLYTEPEPGLAKTIGLTDEQTEAIITVMEEACWFWSEEEFR